MKIVFLDIDGVLNTSREYYRYDQAYKNDPDPQATARLSPHNRHVEHLFGKEHVEALNSLTDQSGAKIVVSSSWRLFYSGSGDSPPFSELITLLKRVGVTGEVIDRTPTVLPKKMSMPMYRGTEIQAWLSAHEEDVENFVILDDDNDMVHLTKKLIRTKGSVGLTPIDVKKALRVLGVES